MPRKRTTSLARGSTCAHDEFKLNLSTGPNPTRACVRDMKQASALVLERTANVGSTEWSTGFEYGDPRAQVPRRIPPDQKAGAVLDSSGKVIAEVSYNGKVWDPSPWHADKKPLFDPAAHQPPPPPEPDREWVRWFNGGYQHAGAPWTPPDAPPPPLDALSRGKVADTFGLNKCALVESQLKRTRNG